MFQRFTWVREDQTTESRRIGKDQQFRMKRRIWLAWTPRLLLLTAFLHIGVCSAGTHSWNGSVSTDWFVANNWTPSGVPGTTDTIYLTNNDTINLSGNVTIGGVFNWSGGSLSGDGMTVQSGGVINMASNANYLYIRLTNGGTVNMTGNAYLEMADNDSSVLGGIYNLAAGLWDIQTNANIYGEGYGDEFFKNSGELRKSGGPGITTINVSFTNVGTVSNIIGTINFGGGGPIAGSYGTAAGAIINFDSGSFTVGALPIITGSGLCEFTGATLTLNSNYPPGLVLVGGNLVLGPNFQNHGAVTNLTVGGMTLVSNNTVTGTLNLGSVTVYAPLTIESGGVLNLVSNAIYLYYPLTNAGTVNMSGNAYLEVANNGSSVLGGIYNLAGALWDMQTNASVNDEGYGHEFFKNSGEFLKSGGTGTTSITVPFTNFGTVSNLMGTVSFGGGGPIDGSYDTAAAAIIDFYSGSFTVGALPSFTGSGLCEFTGSTLTLNSNYPPGLVLVGGNLVLGPNFQNHGSITNLTVAGMTLVSNNTVTGTLNLGSVTLYAPLTIESGGILNFASNAIYLYYPLTNAGTVTMTGNAYLEVANNGSSVLGGIYNLAGALWDIQTNTGVYDEGYGDEFFKNSGELRKSGGLGTSSITVPFTNFGTVSNLMGTMSFGGGGPIEGTYDTSAGATIDFYSGNFTVGTFPIITGSGLCEFTGTTLTLKTNNPPGLVLVSGNLVLGPNFQNHGSITNLTVPQGVTLVSNNTVTGTLTLDGVTLSAPLTIESGGVLNFASNANYLYITLTNAGTVTMSGNAYLEVANNDANVLGGVYNLAGALWDIQTNATIYDEGYGHEFFNNSGEVRKSGGTGTAAVNVPFTDSGTANSLTGILNFGGAFTMAGGTLAFGVSGLNTFGQINISGAVALNGTASVTWLDGYLPIVGDSFALLDYGSHTGTFANVDLASGFLGVGGYTSTVFSVIVTTVGTQTNSPVLSIERGTPGTVLLLWPADSGSFNLQTLTNLASGTWSDITSGIATVGTNFVHTNTITGKAAFFRLQAP